MLPPFKTSGPTLGIELELQIIDARTLDLATDASDMLRRVKQLRVAELVKPEITQSMIEINSSVHASYADLIEELFEFRDGLSDIARKMNVRIAGGGTHPFHQWNDRRIFPGERFQQLHARYGYLAKLFTVFGQHIHLGCENADQAIYLTHAFTRYLPQFIALSAASPFYQGADSAFDSSRLSVVNAFPLSGVMPYVRDWSEFGAYYQKMERLGIVQSMKDFYWDVRPKPEYGTVEIRVCDTPLTVEKAAVIAAYARVLADYLIAHEQRDPEIYAVHAFNRFQACRYGYKGMVVDTHDGIRRAIGEDILQTLDRIAPHARPGDVTALMTLRDWITAAQNDAGWLRAIYQKTGSFEDTVRLQSDRWMSPQPLRQGRAG